LEETQPTHTQVLLIRTETVPEYFTIKWSRSINGDAVDCKSAVLDMPGSIPGCSTID